MLSRALRLSVILSALILLPATGHAAGVMAKGGYILQTAGAAKTSAVYLTLMNTGDADAELKDAAVNIDGVTEIHRTVKSGDRMSMQAVDDPLTIPAGGMTQLRPGGLHIMLMNLEAPIRKDGTYAAELTLTGGQILTVPLTVLSPVELAKTFDAGAMSFDGHQSHGDDDIQHMKHERDGHSMDENHKSHDHENHSTDHGDHGTDMNHAD